jgi:trans-2,3-dihydro-3-hydroxyanthranilate isomerase
MEQPLPTITPYPEEAALLQALGIAGTVLPVTVYDSGIPHLFAMLDHPEEVASLSPDLAALSRLSRESTVPVLGFNVFAGSGTAWKSRMFAPAAGIPEDSATGSAAGPLALHLTRHRRLPWGTEVTIAQGEEIGRPSTLFARVSGAGDRAERIEVAGHAVPVGGGWFDARLFRRE